MTTVPAENANAYRAGIAPEARGMQRAPTQDDRRAAGSRRAQRIGGQQVRPARAECHGAEKRVRGNIYARARDREVPGRHGRFRFRLRWLRMQ